MELANNQYIKLNKFDIIKEILKATDEEDNSKTIFFQNLLRTVMDYEKKNKLHIECFYIGINELQNQEFFKISEIPITRQTLLNAILIAIFNNDIDIAQKITSFIIKKELLPSELGDLLDYILNNSIDMKEYIDGEKERFIYNVQENKIEKEYIFQSPKSKKLELK